MALCTIARREKEERKMEQCLNGDEEQYTAVALQMMSKVAECSGIIFRLGLEKVLFRI